MQVNYFLELKKKYKNTFEGKERLRNFIVLLWALVMRDFKGRYRRSFLGPAWALIQPLFYMVIFTFIRGVLNISTEGVPYVLFTYSALVPWSFFSNAVTRCAPSVYSNAGIVKKISLRREVFPLSSIVISLLDFLIASFILIGMMIWFRVPITVNIFWVLPLILLLSLLSAGVGFFVAAFGTYRRDIIYAIPFLMQFWLLASPVMYPLGQVPERWKSFYAVNPLVGLIEGFREVLVRGSPPNEGLLLTSIVGIMIILLISWPLFRYMSQYFADVL